MPENLSVAPSEVALAHVVVRARPRVVPLHRSWAEAHPTAAALEQATPGPGLVSDLAALEPADLDDAELLEGIAAWERVTSWATAHQATLIAELERRAPSTQVEFVPDEIATRLTLTRRTATHLVDRARALDTLPEVHDTLTTGTIDTRRADTLIRATAHHTTHDARTLITQVLPRARNLTGPQLRAATHRAEAHLDPGAWTHRHQVARRERSVRMTPAPDAMAWLTAYLPATDAMTIWTTLDALATTTAPDDDRPLDARRADALTDALRAVLDTGHGPHGPLPTHHGRRPHTSG